MITRKALIIICPGEGGKPDSLPGTIQDAEKFEKFLYSDIGGEWSPDEVQRIVNPSISYNSKWLNWLKSADYSLVIFSGHGGTNMHDRRVYLQLPDGDICEDDLIMTKKSTLIIDTCRTYYRPVQESIEMRGFVRKEYLKIRNARQIYNESIEKAEEGVVYMHSASVNQASSVGPDGSYYIVSLLAAVDLFGKTAGADQIMNIAQAHCSAVQILINNHPKSTQNPTITGTIKRRYWYPFSLRSYKKFGS